MRMNQDLLRTYAQLLLKVGVNLQPGMRVNLNAEPIHWPFLNLLAEEAYKMGASFVHVNANHPSFGRIRMDHVPEEHLDFVPGYLEHRYEEMINDNWCTIGFFGSEIPKAMAGVDSKRQAIASRANRAVSKPFSDACGSGRVPWTVAALPTPAWAAKVFECEPSEEAVERLWQEMIPILRLDQEDPAATWCELAETTKARSKVLTDLGFSELHFTTPSGTDLRVTLIDQGIWEGGLLEVANGHAFVPNLPTEEVFTAPHCLGTNGRALVTRPVEVLGEAVVGAWFEFKDGEVIDYGAEEGKRQLDTYFEIDPKAKFLGEIALVDGSSPIFQSGKIFHSILYDENAACHMALGSAYPIVLAKASEMTPDELQAAGVNQCMLHTDFMIGSAEVDVDGIQGDGSVVPLLRNGDFCGPLAT